MAPIRSVGLSHSNNASPTASTSTSRITRAVKPPRVIDVLLAIKEGTSDQWPNSAESQRNL